MPANACVSTMSAYVSHDGFSDNVFSGRPRVVEPTLVETLFSGGGKHDVLEDLVDAVLQSRLVKFGGLVDSNLTLNFNNNIIKKKKRISKAHTMRLKNVQKENRTQIMYIEIETLIHLANSQRRNVHTNTGSTINTQ